MDTSQGMADCALRILTSSTYPKNSEFPLLQFQVVIGSDANQAQIVLQDVKVSGAHALMVREGDGYSIYDKDSVSGTFVNNEELKRGHKMMPGDKIRIGDTTFTFVKKGLMGSGATSTVAILMDLGAVAVILVLVAGYYYTRQQDKPLVSPFAAADSAKESAIETTNGFVPWTGSGPNKDDAVYSFKQGRKGDAREAKMHYDRGMKAFNEKTLDPANALSADLAMRRAMAAAFQLSSDQRPFDNAELNRIVKESHDYLQYQKKKYFDAYFRAKSIGDKATARICLTRLKEMFSDKFSNDKTIEYKACDDMLKAL